MNCRLPNGRNPACHDSRLTETQGVPGRAPAEQGWFSGGAAGFTMIEVALCLAIIGFALVSILLVLPLGMNHQRETRERTMVSQDATMLLEAIKSGTRGMDDLTNYVYAITNFFQNYSSLGRPGKLHKAGYTFNAGSIDGAVNASMNISNGLRIIGLMSTPEYTANPSGVDLYFGGAPLRSPFGWEYTSNRVYVYVRSLSGLAAEKPPQNNAILRGNSFSYRIICVNAPEPADTNVMWNGKSAFENQLGGNVRQFRLLFQWPLLPNQSVPSIHNNLTFRSDVAGALVSTNDYFGNGMQLYFCQSQSFTNAP